MCNVLGSNLGLDREFGSSYYKPLTQPIQVKKYSSQETANWGAIGYGTSLMMNTGVWYLGNQGSEKDTAIGV